MPGNSQLGSSKIREAWNKLAQLASRSNQGQDLIEYALLAGFVAVAVAAFIPFTVTGPISGIFNKITNFLVSHANG
jgi:Flp pilus assembly pilin Flp